jgi:RPA family protein
MSAAPTRESAVRVFAEEYEGAVHSFKMSDDDRAPNYVLLPSGARANRVFIVGTMTEVELKESQNGNEYFETRVVDPTGAFTMYVGQYEPQPESVLRNMEVSDLPRYVAIIAKTGTFGGDDGGDARSTLRPEHIAVLDDGPTDQSAAAMRDRWVAETVEHTLERIESDTEAVEFDEETDDMDEMVVDLVTDGRAADAAELRYGSRAAVADAVLTALDSIDG